MRVIVQAPAPSRPIDRGLAGHGLTGSRSHRQVLNLRPLGY
jgi:transposase